MDYETPLKKIKLELNSNESIEHYSENDIQKFNEIKEKFTKSFELSKKYRLSNQIADMLQVQLNENQEILKKKIVIALFGAPGKGKSSSVNFMLTGDFESPLPNSLKSGKGVTQNPIRCEYTPADHYRITLVEPGGEESLNIKKTADVKSKLAEIMNSKNDYSEIRIEIPLKYKPKSSPFPDNIQFLDLVGSPELDQENVREETSGMKKNREAIKAQDIHAVFILGDRSLCSLDIIKHMWEINIFTDLKDRIIPKLIMFKIIQAWKFNRREVNESLEGFKNNTCLRSIQGSLISAFDFEFRTEEVAQFTKLNTRTAELPIQNKANVVPRLYKLCDSLCIVVDKDKNGNNEIRESSMSDIRLIIEILIQNIQEFSLIRSYETIAVILTETIRKVKSKMSGLKRRNNETSSQIISFLYNNHEYNNMIEIYHEKIKIVIEKSINEILQDNLTDAWEVCELDEEGQRLTIMPYQKIYFRINEIYETSIEDLATIFKNFISELDSCIRKKVLRHRSEERRNEISREIDDMLSEFSYENFKDIIKLIFNKEGFNKMFYNFALKKHVFINEIDDREIKKFIKSQKDIVNKRIFSLREDIIENLDLNAETVARNIVLQQELDDLQKYNKDLHLLREEVQSILKQNIDRDEHIEFIEMREPQLYNVNGSIRFPDLSLDNEIPNIDYCFKNHWLNTDKKDAKASDLLAKGRVKSELILNHKGLSKEFNKEINDLRLKNAIQIHIDRKEKSISAEYDEVKIGSIIKNIHENINELSPSGVSTHLYPIFMTSRLRDATKYDGTDETFDKVKFMPNILVKDLCKRGSPIKRFVVFLFIEGGQPGNRKDFEKDLHFYKKLTENEFENAEQKPSEENPVVLCFWPERNLGIGRKRKMMMMFAEHLNLSRFYFADDDIDCFFEYDARPHVRQLKSNPLTAPRAFYYMSKVLDYGIAGKDDKYGNDIEHKVDAKLSNVWLRKLGRKEEDFENDLTKKALFDKLYEIISDKDFKQKEYILYLLMELGEPVKDLYEEIREALMNKKEKTIGQIGLWNQNMYSMKQSLLSRLQGNNKTTHYISKIRYQLVLYNLRALKGIHPVSDKALFEAPLSQTDRASLCHKAMDKGLDNKYAQEAARLGYKYSDKAHVYYQILNGVTGYLVYYFSFTDFKNTPSKVNAAETASYYGE